MLTRDIDTGVVLLTDLLSSNGTKVDGAEIEPQRPVRVRNGQTIVFGKLKVEFLVRLTRTTESGALPLPSNAPKVPKKPKDSAASNVSQEDVEQAAAKSSKITGKSNSYRVGKLKEAGLLRDVCPHGWKRGDCKRCNYGIPQVWKDFEVSLHPI